MIYAISVLCCFASIEGAQYPALSSTQSTEFQKQLDSAVSTAETRVQELKSQKEGSTPTWNSKLELQNAIVQLEVKKTLVNNFKNTESLRSDSVRNKLAEILNKPIITTADLADLQSLVLQEKANIRAEDAATAPALSR